jgi:DNA-binding NarL/FixJ family response regulator
VLKEAGAADLECAIDEALAGRRHLSPPLSEKAIAAYAEKSGADFANPFDILTTREREVLQLAAVGLTNNEIGRRLFISPRTVETHRSSLMHKLGLQHHADLIRFAMQKGLITTETGPDLALPVSPEPEVTHADFRVVTAQNP